MIDKIDLAIYINMFVHYPETYNAYTISGKFNIYFNEYFSKSKLFYNQECNVMINSSPNIEDEIIIIEAYLSEKRTVLINKESFIMNCKKFTTEYFNNQIKKIEIKILSLNN